MLSPSRLRQLLNYDPETGIFTWRVQRQGRAHVGTRAGATTASGYLQICIDRALYQGGPLAVLYMTGKWPKQFVDHINNNPSDNRWSNLREANYSRNGANARPWKMKRYSPLKGVTWHHGKYAAQIKVNGRAIWLGRFETAEEAHAAYRDAAVKHFGEFANH